MLLAFDFSHLLVVSLCSALLFLLLARSLAPIAIINHDTSSRIRHSTVPPVSASAVAAL